MHVVGEQGGGIKLFLCFLLSKWMVGESAGKEFRKEMASLKEKVMNLVSILG